MKTLRKKIYDVIEPNHLTKWSKVYDGFMLVVIVLSILPLTFRTEIPYFNIIDKITVLVFILDYFLRWITADFSKPHKSKWKTILILIQIISSRCRNQLSKCITADIIV